MKNKTLLIITLIISVIIVFPVVSCTEEDSIEDYDITIEESECSYEIADFTVLDIVYPGDCNIGFNISNGEKILKDFYPVFGDNPNDTTYDYGFIIRRGTANNLLFNFMGGGACWSDENCIYQKTNATYSDIAPLIPTPALIYTVQKGIVLNTNDDNPFEDWTLIYLPYTTADLHWGSNEYDYEDAEGNKITVHHRGHDNFLSALRYVRDNFPPGTINKIFITGQSAGAYGAVFNAGYIKETYKDSAIYILGDAGNGVVTEQFMNASINNWNIVANIPRWIPGITEENYVNLSVGDCYKLAADYYPEVRFAQYTAMYDGNQRFFYEVMLNITDFDYWKTLSGSGYNTPDSTTCDWRNNMLSQREISGAADNYQAYIAPGDVHTITTSEDMYILETNGVNFVDWMEMMINDDPDWDTVICSDCQPPNTSESPEGMSCD